MTPDPEVVSVCLDAIRDEYVRARLKHPPIHSGHEGYAVIREELDELWDEIKLKVPERTRLLREASQVAAMALAFMVEVAATARPKVKP